jgi:ribosomal protein L30E
MSLEELKKALKENRLIYGKDRTMKMIKSGKAVHIFLASNCESVIKQELKKLANISKIEITELKESNEELGTICKKTFSISVACC